MFKNFNGFEITWNDLWAALGYATAIMFGLFLLASVTTRHTVNGYYLGESIRGYCVYASVDFDLDTNVFCSDDIGKAILVAEGANHVLRGH